MKIEVLPDAGSLAQRAAAAIAHEARSAVAARGRCLLALSGGNTSGPMLRRLAQEEMPWARVHLFQVDERVAPPGDPARNLTQIEVHLPHAQIHAMPVEDQDLEAAAARYAVELQAFAGTPVVLDLVHLGLGADGHTASLVPGDPVLEVTAADVAITRPYLGRQRMTLTFPALDRARRIFWLVSGAEKHDALARLRSGDSTIPAGRVNADRAVMFVDQAAAGSSSAT